MPLIKICGLTRLADLGLALRLGAGYVGAIVDIPRSPRSLPASHAARLFRAAEGCGVAVTDYCELDRLLALASTCRPAALQLHGDQNPALVAALTTALASRGEAVEVWAILSMPADSDEARQALPRLAALARDLAASGAVRLVLDSKVAGQSGGTGVPVNWQLAAELVARCPVPVLIAGGISPANASEALQTTGAAGVDVSSCVELRPGVKSPARLHALMRSLGAVAGSPVPDAGGPQC